ncbi:MAG: ABC transporter ATP-binding protein [Oscillospiraceae bacterium]|nr:ABC transporter ATP-binding protein [Oscillospiraceae bacterium]
MSQTSNETQNMIVCNNLVKIFKTSDIEVVALQGLDLIVQQGEMMAIIGSSGSGKSTLLNILGGLDIPSAGQVMVNGLDLTNLTKAQLCRYKSSSVGFVWQNTARNSIPYLSALENLELPMILNGSKDTDYAKSILDYVGLADKMHRRTVELSGGEQQRVAIGIALANKPPLILADEPTGAVDSKTTEDILSLLKRVSTEMGITIVLVTHDRQVSSFVDRVAAIRDGRTSSEFIRIRRDSAGLSSESADSEDNPNPDDNTHEEYAVIDRVGRLQIPAAHLKELGIQGRGRVKVALEDGQIVIRS